MSRSNNVDIKNPTTKVYTWSGSKGKFMSYDKETKVKTELELPIKFIALDALSCIRGFNPKEEEGYYCNEVRDLKKEVMHVRTKKGIFIEGYYSDIKDSIPGGKYTQSVYALVKEGDVFLVVNIQLNGSSLGSWIEFRKKNQIFEGAIAIKSSTEGKTGATVYRIPVYETVPLTPETESLAKEQDKELQKYIKAMLARNITDAPNAEEVNTTEELHEEPVHNSSSGADDLPF